MVDYHLISEHLIKFGLYLEHRRFHTRGLSAVCPHLTYKKIVADVQI
jgi:hypothetical protein